MKRFFSVLAALAVGTSALAIDARTAARANNQFGVNLFKASTARSAKGNKFLSPTSAFLALSMLDNGAEGTTRAGIETTLALAGITREELNDANLLLMSKLQTGRDFTLGIANSLWGKKGYDLKQDFTNVLRTNYSATVEELDFSLPIAPQTINDWVKAKTNNKIDSIVASPLPPDLRLILINATYFDAKWTEPFEPNYTQDSEFRKADGTRVQVPFMNTTYSAAHHVKTANYEAISLPYGKAQDADMVVVVPTDLAKFEASLTGAAWQQILAGLDASKGSFGTLSLPSLEFSMEAALDDSLKALGMKEAFDFNKADFSSITDENVAVTSVLQKTYVKVFEEGTIAAAVTSISVGASAIPQYDFQMEVNRPYLFGIRCKRTGALLFLGSISEPEGGKLPVKKNQPEN